MHPSIPDCLSDAPIDFERLRSEIVVGGVYQPSFGRHEDLDRQIAMLRNEFVGQSRLKFAHAVLNVLLRRGISSETVYQHFSALWLNHADILLDTLDSRWLISACDTIADYSPDPAEAQSAILISLFANTLKLSETERLIAPASDIDPGRIRGRTPLFDGMTAFMSGGGDMPMNLVNRLERTLDPETLVGKIGREVVSRALSADTVYRRFALRQISNRWASSLSSAVPVAASRGGQTLTRPADDMRPGYILLNDTGRLGGGYHMGTVYACASIRQHLDRRGLREIGWANDASQFNDLLAGEPPAIVVLNGEGTLHHGARRAAELLSLCAQAKASGLRVAVLNTVWEDNPEHMAAPLRVADLVSVRDALSLRLLPAGVAATVAPDVSISLFRDAVSDGNFIEPTHEIGVIDSVLPNVSSTLVDFAEQHGLPFYAMPVGSLRAVRASVLERAGSTRPRLLQLPDLMGARSWVTGRFHGLIAALCAGLPVCALGSNTAKVAGLLQDAGLADACLLGPDWLSASADLKRANLDICFEKQRQPEFVERREAYLGHAVEQIDLMFDAVADIAKR